MLTRRTGPSVPGAFDCEIEGATHQPGPIEPRAVGEQLAVGEALEMASRDDVEAIDGSYRSHRPADDGLVEQIVEEANDQLTGATRRTVDFVIGLDKPIQRVLVTGGTEHLPDLTQQLDRRLSCPVEPWPGDSIDAVRVGTGVDQAMLRRWSRQLGVALGLCTDPRPTLQVPGLGAQRGLGGWLRSLLG